MPFVDARDGTRLYVHDWGSGPAVVLIHGWPLSADSWEKQHTALAEAGFRVVAYDRRGFGRSDKPWTGYDYDTLADDTAAVVQGLGLTDVSLVGFSMGGGEVARYGSRHGGLKRTAFLGAITPWLKGEGGADDPMLDGMKQALRDDRPGFLSGFFDNFYSGQASDEVLRWSWSTAMQASLPATVGCVEAWKTDFRPDMAAFAGVPTLVIHGTDDRIVPIHATGRRMPEAIPGAKLIEYDGAPHGFLATHGERVTQDLLAFLRG
jgi:pimeloyl-ACP methyl ester carboxylesterase